MEDARGFSFVEVLIALVLVSVGILGAVTLQNKIIQFTQDATNRNLAIILAHDLVEIMRTHRDEFFHKKPPFNYTYSQIKEFTEIYNSDGSISFNSDGCQEYNIPQELLEQVSCWMKLVEVSLPGVADLNVKDRFKICPSFRDGKCAGANYKGSSLEVQLAWHAKRNECFDSAGEKVCTYRIRVEL